MHKFELGVRVRCKITDFTGIAYARLEYLNGCVQYGVKPRMAQDNAVEPKIPDTIYIDDVQLEFVDNGVTDIKQREGGGPETRIVSNR